MKQKKHNGLFLLTGIVLVLAVASVVGLYAAKKVKQATYQPQRIVTKITPTVTPNPTSLIDSIVGNATTIEDIDTSHWKTFTSSNSSFSYKYPSVGVKLSRDTLQPSYLQFSAEDPSEDESNNEVFNNPEIVIAFARGSAEYKAYTPAFDHIDKKNITIDGKQAHEDIFSHNGKITDIIIYFDEFAEKPNEDSMSNTYSSRKYGFGLIWVGISPKNYQKVNDYLLLAEKIVSTLKFLK